MGHHGYQKKWDAVIGEILEAKMEPTNDLDKYAVHCPNLTIYLNHNARVS